MKYLSVRFVLLALLVIFGVVSTAVIVFGDEGSGVNSPSVDPDGLKRLIDETGADVQLAWQTGTARFVRWTGNNAQRISARFGTSGSAQSRADAFLREYGSVFGIRDVATELVLAKSFTDTLKTEHLVYTQIYQGVPVFAGNIRVHFDGRGALTAVNGMFIPKIVLNPKPTLSEENARQIAISHVGRSLALDVENPRQLSIDLNSKNARLYIFRAGLAQGVVGANHLVYEVEVVSGAAVREFVYVDAHTGAVVEQITGIHEDLSRRVYDGGYESFFQVWQEEDGPYLGNDADIRNISDFSKDTYDLFTNLSGGSYRSYDGRDARMESVNNDPNIFCPNANWNGFSTNYCSGVTGDDTVAHEWGHAYTQNTHNLIYAWQPGALNESYSDIIGEIVDLSNGAGLDTPGGPRTPVACSAFQSVLPVSVQINTPAAIAGVYAAGGAEFGPRLDITGVTGDLVVVNDGDNGGGSGTTTDGCQPLTNAGALAGKIAVIDRGVCNFIVKVKNAQNAGAMAALILNQAVDGDDVFNMSGSDVSITIPGLGHRFGQTSLEG